MKKQNNLKKFTFLPAEYQTSREIVEARAERLGMPTKFRNLTQKITIYYASIESIITFFAWLDKIDTTTESAT